MSIRQAMAAIKAAIPAGRKAVTVNSPAQAQAVKRHWGIMDSIRTLSQRVNFLAEAMDKAAAEKPILERAMQRQTLIAARDAKRDATKAALAHTAEVMATSATVIAQFNAARFALEQQRDRALEAAMDVLNVANRKAYGDYCDKRDAINPKDFYVNECFGSESVRLINEAVDKLYEAYADTFEELWDQHDSTVAAVHEEFNRDLESHEFLLWTQLRALASGNPLPTLEDCPGLIVVRDDGSVSGLDDPEGSRLFEQFRAESAGKIFG